MLTAIIVGAGHRALTYASYAQQHPDQLRIVGVADPIAARRQAVAELYDLPTDRCFESAAALAAQPKLADFVINGTMDQQHVPTSLPLIEAGYHLLLEKPFATHAAEMWQLVESARRNQRKVIVCHVLRFAPFYTLIRQKVIDGVIGELLNIQAVEHVSYHHMAVGFVRGKWNNKTRAFSPMLMAKCCHDLDLITWIKSGVPPVRVASFGSNMQFRPEKAPAQAGTRCLVDCPIEPDCLYSARKHYIDHPNRWAFYVWDVLQHGTPATANATPIPNKHYSELTLEEKIASLQGDNPYGRCVWKCDNDVVDHQSVAIEFADGTTATLNMVGGAAKPSRLLHLVGTQGEIQGALEDSRFVIRHIDPRPGHEYRQEVVDLNLGGGMAGDMTGAFAGHGGGDMRLVADCLRVLRGEPASISTTTLEDSVYGHLLGFCADQSMVEGSVVAVNVKSV